MPKLTDNEDLNTSFVSYGCIVQVVVLFLGLMLLTETGAFQFAIGIGFAFGLIIFLLGHMTGEQYSQDQKKLERIETGKSIMGLNFIFFLAYLLLSFLATQVFSGLV